MLGDTKMYPVSRWVLSFCGLCPPEAGFSRLERTQTLRNLKPEFRNAGFPWLLEFQPAQPYHRKYNG